MEILQLYKMLDEQRALNKTLSNPIEISGTFRSEIDEIDIEIDIETNNYDFNYVFVESLNKYYFVNTIQYVNNDICRLYLHCDVLMTYRNDILNSFGFVTKGGNINPYFSRYTTDCRRNIQTHQFLNMFGGDTIIVVTKQTNGFEAK